MVAGHIMEPRDQQLPHSQPHSPQSVQGDSSGTDNPAHPKPDVANIANRIYPDTQLDASLSARSASNTVGTVAAPNSQDHQEAARADNLVGLTGSSLSTQKVPLPKGIFVVVIYVLWACISGFFYSGPVNVVFDAINTAVTLLDLLIVVGLLLRLEVARKFAVWTAALLLALSCLSILLLANAEYDAHIAKAQYEYAISRLKDANLTLVQKQELSSVESLVAAAEKTGESAFIIAYIRDAAIIVGSTAVIWYLKRPNVKSTFRELER